MTVRRQKRRGALSPDDERLWRQVVRDAAPLTRDTGPERVAGVDIPDMEQPEGPARPPAADGPVTPPRALEPFTIGGATDGAAKVTVSRPLPGLDHGHTAGIDRRTAKRFLRGRMVIDGTLDLHGMSREVAHAALFRFIERGAAAGQRCLLVVTGKGNRGEGVLRQAVPGWLNDARLRPHILSFSHAQPGHGGAGALYVLLRRRRDDRA